MKMNKHQLVHTLRSDCNQANKLSAARQLQAQLYDIDVIRALCFESIKTDSHKLRACIIGILKNRPHIANKCFSYIAMHARRTAVRKWALVNLSLMECIDAKEAVIKGLRDTSKAVQSAAALNIGLYHDPEFQKEVERFFNKNRLEYVIFNLCHQDNVLNEPMGHEFR
jgi:HEAT repeat protein